MENNDVYYSTLKLTPLLEKTSCTKNPKIFKHATLTIDKKNIYDNIFQNVLFPDINPYPVPV